MFARLVLSLYCVPIARLDAANCYYVMEETYSKHNLLWLLLRFLLESRIHRFWCERKSRFQSSNRVLSSYLILISECNSRTVGHLSWKLHSVQAVPGTKHVLHKYLFNKGTKSFRTQDFNIYWLWAFCLTLVGTQRWGLLHSAGLGLGLFSSRPTLK